MGHCVKNSPLVSVIIPIYNVEQYLQECLNSVLNQTYKHLEIILVNDGSTDRSPEIAQEYTTKDSRIRYFTQENKGQSAARNKGLQSARGEYIYFMDSDDYIDIEYIDEMLRESMQDSIVINFNVLFEFADSTKRFNLYKTLKGKFSLCADNINAFDFFVCNCLFAKSVIDRYKIRFIEGKICEDAGFLFQIMPFARYIVCIDTSAYHYRQRQDSTTGKLAKNNEVTLDRIDIFIFLTHWYYTYSLVDRCGLPFQILYEVYPYHHNAETFYKKAKETIRELNVPKDLWVRDKIMRVFMECDDVLDFMYKRDMLQTTQRRKHRIRLFKNYNVIRFFGKTFYEGFSKLRE